MKPVEPALGTSFLILKFVKFVCVKKKKKLWDYKMKDRREVGETRRKRSFIKLLQNLKY